MSSSANDPQEPLRLARSNRSAEALLHAVLTVGQDLDLREMLTRIVRSACDMVGARYGALGVIRPDLDGLLEFIAVGLTEQEAAAIGPLPRGAGLLGTVVREARSIRCDDIARHPDSVGFPPGHPPMRTFLGVPVLVRGEAFANLYLTDKVGGLDFSEEDQALVEALAAAAGIAIDNARLYEMARRQQQWSEALAAMSQALMSGTDPREALGQLVERACAAAEADLATVALLGEDGSLVVEAATGSNPAARTVVGTPFTESHWRAVLETGEPLMLLSNEGEPTADPVAGVLRTAAGLSLHGQTVLVPMTVGEESIGLLVVAWEGAEGHVAYAAAEPLKQYADQAAVTLTAATAQRDRELVGVLEDRERIARDMHDVVIQRLFATGLGLQAALRLAVHPYVQSRLLEAVDELDIAIRDIRRSIFALQQPVVTSLEEELMRLAHGFVEPLRFEPGIVVEGDPVGLDEELRMDVLAVVREGLSNVARHAEATAVTVRVIVKPELTRVVVEDNGRGFIETGRRSGLSNLRERAVRRAGSCSIGLATLGGSRLEWEVPRSRG